MNLESQRSGEVVILRVRERRLIFPMLESFIAAVRTETDRGAKHVVLCLSDVEYLDSPAHGSLVELYTMVTDRGGTLKLVGLQPRVEAMASLVGITKMVESFADESLALASFGVPPAGGKSSPI
jgi:anti-sigma B factor antagonist